jgi:hypothetical protein
MKFRSQFLIASIFVCSVLVLGAGCSTSSNPDTTHTTSSVYQEIPDFKTFRSDELQIKIQYPSDWAMEDNGSIVSFSSPDIETLNVTSQPTTETLQQITDRIVADYKSSVKKFNLLESKDILVGPYVAKKITYNYTTNDEKYNFRTTQIFLLSGKTEYIITYLHQQSDVVTHQDEIDKMVNSFRVVES